MTMFKPLEQTRDTVTLKRTDFDALLRSVEDTADLAAVDVHRAYEDRVGWDTARWNYLAPNEARRLLDGESPVRVWREKRGIKQRTLAEAAEVAVSYLAEIEGGKKPGSAGALQRIASVLEMPLETLISTRIASPGLRPVSRAEDAARRLIALCETNAAWDHVAQQTRATVDEWQHLATQSGQQHQMQATIETLYHRLAVAMKDARAEQAAMKRDGQDAAAKQNMARALGAALDSLSAARDEMLDEHNRIGRGNT